MKLLLPAGVAVVYFIQGYLHYEDSEYGFMLMWAAYGLANIGAILAIRGW